MNSSFEKAALTTTTWLTPLSFIRALGSFDLDPCTPATMPWKTAQRRYTPDCDGLAKPWSGRVWLNPPYGRNMDKWLEKMALHGNGIALLFNRMDSQQFHRWVFPYADAMLIKKGRIQFLTADGTLPRDASGRKRGGAGTGSLFIAYGKENVDALFKSGIDGKIVSLK